MGVVDLKSTAKIVTLVRKYYHTCLLVIGVATAATLKASAQNEYLATLNYTTLSVNRLDHIPGVTWITNTATYDQNHRRFFFQGNTTGAPPYNLYTLDAVTGAVLYSVVCPTSATGLENVFGLQYDNATDTLYGLYLQETPSSFSTYFCCVDPITGAVHILNHTPLNAQSFSGSAFDTKHHRYFAQGVHLMVINASNGNVLYTNPSGNFSDIAYDDVTGKLYGIVQSPSNTEFDSIGISSGTQYPIKVLPAMSIPAYGCYTIDEAMGRYVFVGLEGIGTVCQKNHLFALDMNAGSVVSDQLFPYSNSTGNISDENVIEFSFDHKDGVLYVLNGHVSSAPPVDSVVISVSANPVCGGDSASFMALVGQGLTNPSCQWLLNGKQVGIDSPGYINSHLVSGDTIRCLAITDPACAPADTVVSNYIVMQVSSSTAPSVSITSSVTTVCPDSVVTFRAVAANAGSSPVYQWQVNGVDVGADSSVFSYPSTHAIDTVDCLVNPFQGICNSSAPSNLIILQQALVSLDPDPFYVTIQPSADPICKGASVSFKASVASVLTAPSYQWTMDSKPVGGDSLTYASNQLSSGDTLACLVIDHPACRAADSASAVLMDVQVVDSAYPAVSISSSASNICSGDTVDFIAAGIGGGSGPTYQWLINGMPIATGDTLVDNALSNGDLIRCLMTSSLSCTSQVSSGNQIIMLVNPRPGIVFSPDTLILVPGSSTVLSPGITGSIATYQWTPSTGLSDPTMAMPQAAPRATTTYQLRVTGADGCTANAFQTVMVYYLLKMPGAFTPNGDGINDVFRIPPSTPQKIAFFKVYNRWGNLVFQTSDANQGWDGTLQQQLQPPGAYIWEIQFQDPLTHKYLIQTGTVSLMR